MQSAKEDELDLAAATAEELMSEGQPEEVFGSPKAGTGMWASCIRVLGPTEVGCRSLTCHMRHLLAGWTRELHRPILTRFCHFGPIQSLSLQW